MPTLEQLSRAFEHLDRHGFSRSSRLPLVAARQWRPSWEREAWVRFRRRLCNVHEVAFPKFYWRAEEPELRRLFRALTLGEEDPTLQEQSELLCLSSRWTVVARFGRYVLRSHPREQDQDLVYLGDDTLFLMQRSRELLQKLREETEGPLRCLDLCCGGGGVGLSLPEFSGDLVGLDLNPVAVRLAEVSAAAQGLRNYRYRRADVREGLGGPYELVFGNPPTLSPALTGRHVFHATGTLDMFAGTLDAVLDSLAPTGRAVLTFFSCREDGEDSAWARVREVAKGRRGFRCHARREYPLGGGRVLRHNVLEVGLSSEEGAEFVPCSPGTVQLPALARRR